MNLEKAKILWKNKDNSLKDRLKFEEVYYLKTKIKKLTTDKIKINGENFVKEPQLVGCIGRSNKSCCFYQTAYCAAVGLQVGCITNTNDGYIWKIDK